MCVRVDLFEVTVLIGSCFLVNYITADAKTNWVEGIIMIAFYRMIVRRRLRLSTFFSFADRRGATQGLSAWYYPGQAEIGVLDACRESIAEALAAGVGAGAGAE